MPSSPSLPSPLLTMRLSYQYRLRPTKAQIAIMENWLELLRRQYNYR
jgi:putative transposase